MSRKSKSKIPLLVVLASVLIAGAFLDFSWWLSPWIEEQAVIPSNPAPDLSVDEEGKSRAVWVIRTEKGDIRIRFYSADAPKTIAHIISLIRTGFYDGLTFHRIVEDFVVQTGDPTSTGTGGSGAPIAFEDSSRPHIPGAVGLARDPAQANSGDSQFYITLGTFPHLDQKFTVFAAVDSGLEVARSLNDKDRIIASFLE